MQYRHIYENIFNQIQNKDITLDWRSRKHNKAGIYLEKCYGMKERHPFEKLAENAKRNPNKMTKSKLRRALDKRRSLLNRNKIKMRIGSKKWEEWKEKEEIIKQMYEPLVVK